jgi:hypothetical protein
MLLIPSQEWARCERAPHASTVTARYGKLMGWRKRHALLDIPKLLLLLQTQSVDEFRAHFNQALEESINNDDLKRQAKWTEAIAVGTQPFIEVVEKMITGRQEAEIHQETGSWALREDYDANSEAKNARPYTAWN